MNKNVYYVYVYLDPTKEGKYNYNNEYHFEYEPFYVGKGCNDRDISHLKCNGTHNKEFKDRIILIKENIGINPVVARLWDNLSEEDAYTIEWKTIRTIGTLYNNKGPLMNKMFSNVYDASVYGNDKTKTYILDHPYITSQKVCIGWRDFYLFCETKKLDRQELLQGKTIDGWSLTLI